MCGIGGILRTKDQVSIEDLKRMIKLLKHRGPDGDDLHLDQENNLGIVHTRLSIIDLETGDQPMWDQSRNVLITFNGELYNFRELRHELERFGHIFRTNSDTEVIIKAYKQWGAKCLDRFRGMFAFCIVDYSKRELFLARDHFGIKPLYYYDGHGVFCFASELAAITTLKPQLSIDLEAIDQYLWLQYIPTPNTVFREIQKLPAGNFLRVSFDRRVLEKESYWNFEYQYQQGISRDEWIERVEHVIEQSVKAHLVSDVPFGAFLSGGLDSTIVVDYMQKNLTQPVKTFTIGFNDEEYSELKYAERVSKKLGTQHHFEVVEPNALEVLPELVKHHGEPFGDSSSVPTYYVSKMARTHVPMVLSGDGGDEAFLGYQSYRNYFRYRAYQGVSAWKKPIHPLLSQLMPGRYPNRDSYQGWMDVIRYLPFPLRKKLWRAPGKATWANREFEEYFSSADTGEPVSKLQYTDLKTYLTDDILTKVDRASMIHGLEVRTPLIDVEVWNLVSRIPPQFNLGFQTENTGKELIKEILRRKFDTDFTERPKQGFSIPANKWLTSGRGVEKVVSLLDPSAKISTLFNKSGIADVIDSRNGNWIWVLLVLEEWLNQQDH